MSFTETSILAEIQQRHPSLTVDDEVLRSVVTTALRAEQVTHAEISLVLTDDAEIHRLNREYLQHDYPTDVISFCLGDAWERHCPRGASDRVLEGELIVSLDTARRVSDEYGWSLMAETVLYVVHGLLHLCGYDDHADADRADMRRREREILERLDLAWDGGNPAAAGWDARSW